MEHHTEVEHKPFYPKAAKKKKPKKDGISSKADMGASTAAVVGPDSSTCKQVVRLGAAGRGKGTGLRRGFLLARPGFDAGGGSAVQGDTPGKGDTPRQEDVWEQIEGEDNDSAEDGEEASWHADPDSAGFWNAVIGGQDDVDTYNAMVPGSKCKLGRDASGEPHAQAKAMTGLGRVPPREGRVPALVPRVANEPGDPELQEGGSPVATVPQEELVLLARSLCQQITQAKAGGAW